MIKEVCKNDLKQALDLVNNVFSEFVATDYSEQGINTFQNYLKKKFDEVSNDLQSGRKKLWGYYQDGKIIGVIATRDTSHIALMFVDKMHHKKGIARQLFNTVLTELKGNGDIIRRITVNSSPYAVRIYERLGFKKTDEQQDKDGIIYVPMAYSLGNECAAQVSIREWKIEDAPDLAVALNNKKIHDNLRDGLPFPYTESDAADFIHLMLNAESDTQYAFAITYGDKVIGSIGVFRKDNVHRLTAELGYYIAEPYWGKGITTKAVQLICDYVFANTDIIRIFAVPFAANIASCRVLEKVGFQVEGILRQNAFKNGQILDMKMYAILNPYELS